MKFPRQTNRISEPSPAYFSQKERDQIAHVPGEIMVKLEAGQDGLQDEFTASYDAKLIETIDLFSPQLENGNSSEILRLKVSDEHQLFQVLEEMQKDQRVAFAEPNQIITLEDIHREPSSTETADGQAGPSVPNDLDPKLWGLNNSGQTGGKTGADVSALEAWEHTVGDDSPQGPLIAVIDTGIDYTHADLAANMWTNPGEIPGDGIDNDENGVVDDVHGYFPAENSGDPMDRDSHGTHCAGTIAARGNDGNGITGVMQRARLMAVKIFDDEGSASTADIVKGIDYATRMGADITSNSWGGRGRSQAIREAFEKSEALHIVAAGNSNTDNDERDYFPANYELDNIVTVAASNHLDQKASFSQYGKKTVDLVAPGRDIWSTIPGGGYEHYSGTSMATPHVSGGVGLLMSAFPDASHSEIKTRLVHGSDRIPELKDVSVSGGRVNFGVSLENDTVAPGAPNDFEVHQFDAQGAELSWTAVGDDKWANGAAQAVEIFVSDKPVSKKNADKAESIVLTRADEVGDLAKYRHQVLPSTQVRTLHFGLQSFDNANNRSELRTTSVTIPALGLVMEDDFEGQDAKFEATGDFQRTKVEGRGTVFSTGGRVITGKESNLTSVPIDLRQSEGSFLKFEYNARLLWDESARVQVSKDQGETWQTLQDLESQKEWVEHGVDLSEYDGEEVQVRFHLRTRKHHRSRGFSLDKVKVLSESTE